MIAVVKVVATCKLNTENLIIGVVENNESEGRRRVFTLTIIKLWCHLLFQDEN